jgi:pyruvate formate lyase activating enzyme
MMATVEFAGITDASTIDCCGKGVCAVVYFCGCPFRCPWCHNPELVNNEEACRNTDLEAIANSLRENFLVRSVTLTGGEPLMQEYLLALIDKIKKDTRLEIKLDTNGFFPKRLGIVLSRIDSVSMDLKAPLDERYGKATGLNERWPEAVGKINESLTLLKNWDGTKEARTTIVPGITDTPDAIKEITDAVAEARFQRYVLQQFRPDKTLDPAYGKLKSPGVPLMRKLGEEAKKALPDSRVYVVSAQRGLEEILR